MWEVRTVPLNTTCSEDLQFFRNDTEVCRPELKIRQAFQDIPGIRILVKEFMEPADRLLFMTMSIPSGMKHDDL